MTTTIRRFIIRRPGRAPMESKYGSIDEILYERIPDQPVENPRLHGESAALLIRNMSAGREMITDEVVARELNIRDPRRIRRAREWLGLTDAGPAPRQPTEVQQAEEFQRFVEDPEPPEAA